MNSFDPWCVLQSDPQMVVPAPYYGSLAPGGPWGCSGGGYVIPFPLQCAIGNEPPRSELAAAIARPLRSMTGWLSAEATLDDQQRLRVVVTADGERRETTLDLGPAIAAIIVRLAALHAHFHGEDVVAAVDRAVGAAGKALADRLLVRQVGASCSGWLDDIGGALKDTLQKLKGPITEAATKAATAYGGPAAGAIVGPVIDTVARGKDTPEKAAAEQQAKTDPTVAQALSTAETVAAQALAVFHVGETAKMAAAGHPEAQQQVAALARDVERGHPIARAVAPIATRAFADHRATIENLRHVAVATVSRIAARHRQAGGTVAAFGYVRHGRHQRTVPLRSPEEARQWYARAGGPGVTYVAVFNAEDLRVPVAESAGRAD